MLIYPQLAFLSRALARSQSEDFGFGFVDGGRQLGPVEHEKRFHRGVPDSLVPIDKRVVLDQGIAQSSRLRREAGIQVVTPETLLRLTQRGLEQAEVAEAMRPFRR